jgi:hypothetical protein
MTNTPPRKKARTATPRPNNHVAERIAARNAKAKKIQAHLNAEQKEENARRAKRAADRAKLEAERIQLEHEIGNNVRGSYLQRHNVASILAPYVNHRNLAMAAIAFKSKAFKNASRERKANLSATLAKYRIAWGRWYKEKLTPNQRISLARNLSRVIHGNSNLRTLAVIPNPLLLVKRGLTLRPPAPQMSNSSEYHLLVGQKWRNAQKRANQAYWRHNAKWGGSLQAVHNLAQPEASRILKGYGLPFSMVKARNNIMARAGLTTRRMELNKRRGRLPLGASLAAVNARLIPRAPKGRRHRKERIVWKQRVAYLS